MSVVLQKEVSSPSQCISCHGSMDPQSFLVVGLACVDIITVSHGFPVEDSDTRSVDYYWQRGGNASNNSTVLAQLGASVEFVSTLANTQELTFIQNDFQEHGIKSSNCIIVDGARFPVSIIIANSLNGSRTILHSCANLREIRGGEFSSLPLSRYRWVHFEGREEVGEMIKMLAAVDKYNEEDETTGRIITSVELEKPRPDLSRLVDKADYVFVGKVHALYRGYVDMEQTVRDLHTVCRPGATVVCTWGELGAVAMSPDRTLYKSSCYPPATLGDTIGAGDTFLAAMIYHLNAGCPVGEALEIGCRLAGAKCGLRGFTGLRGHHVKIMEHMVELSCVDTGPERVQLE